MQGGKNFVDFVVEAQTNQTLAQAFANAKDTGPDLKDFFDHNGFTAITAQECNRLAPIKEKLKIEIDRQVVRVPPEPRY